MLRVALAIAAVAAVANSAAGGSPRPAERDRCNPAGSVTLAESRKARVFKRRSGRERAIYGCAYSTGRAYVLEDPFHERNFVFGPPAIQVRGTLVAYAVNNHGRAQTFIEERDLRFDPAGGRSLAEGVPQRAGRSFGFVKVGSLRLSRRGSIAWIACPEDPGDGNPTANQRPGCVRPGRLDAVWALPHDATRKVLLDRGRSIDPRSMTRRGLRFCWRHAGGLRCRRVP